MPELLSTLNDHVEQFFDAETDYVERTVRRSTVIDIEGSQIDIRQRKHLGPEDILKIIEGDVGAIATNAWFNDVRWIDNSNLGIRDFKQLGLKASYPLNYFHQPPRIGSFIEYDGVNRWLEEYGSIDGVTSRDVVRACTPRFVTPGERTVTELRYPDDPDAISAYNARYRTYMDQLDSADTTITYYRGWMREAGRTIGEPTTPNVIGGLSLAGAGLNRVLKDGPTLLRDDTDWTHIILENSDKKDAVYASHIWIADGKAINTEHTDVDKISHSADEELLMTALRLVIQATKPRY